MLTMSPVLRDERHQLYQMVEEYWRLRLSTDHFARDPLPRSNYFDDEFWDEKETRFLWWAKTDGNIIGFAVTELVDDPAYETHGQIDDLYITASFRRQGHGREFARLLFDWFTRQGVNTVRLFVRQDNPDALVFWEKEGFETVQVWYQMRRTLR